VVGSVRKVITRCSGNSDDLGQGVSPRLTGFRLDRVQNFISPIEDQIMKALNDPRSLCKRELFPALLSFTRA
jgi:hypothetical protein